MRSATDPAFVDAGDAVDSGRILGLIQQNCAAPSPDRVLIEVLMELVGRFAAGSAS